MHPHPPHRQRHRRRRRPRRRRHPRHRQHRDPPPDQTVPTQRGTWRFSLGVDITCPHGDPRLWLSPHATDADPTLPEHLRLIPPDDPDFKVLYGLRNDSESFNNQYKRTLLVDRATSVGWERQLFDLLAFAILENSRAWATPRHLRAVA